ncbi:MAG: hypothetical protein WC479_07100 [Candidatus Izemoplasmatales bacterium]|jgi:hypothetical protein
MGKSKFSQLSEGEDLDFTPKTETVKTDVTTKVDDTTTVVDDKTKIDDTTVITDTTKVDDITKVDETVKTDDVIEIKDEDVFKEFINTPEIKAEDLEVKDWTKLAKFNGFELKENTPDAYKTAYQVHLEKQKQQVDLSGYNEASQVVINHIKDGGDITDFLDPLAPINKAMALSPEEKAKVALGADGVKADKIEGRIEQLKDNEEFDDFIAEIDADLKVIRDEKIKEVAKNIKEKQQENQNKLSGLNASEKSELINVVKKTSTFLDLPVSEAIRNTIVEKINDGSFQSELDNAETMVQAYMSTKFAPKIKEYYTNKIASERRLGYNEGLAKGKEGLTNAKPKVDISGGHNAAADGKKGFRKLAEEVSE